MSGMREGDYEEVRARFDQGPGHDGPLWNHKVAYYQYELAGWQNVKFGAVPPEQSALGIAEEVGELAESFLALSASAGRLSRYVLKHAQKTRGFGDIELLRRMAADALGDIMVFCASLATVLRLDLMSCYERTAMRVMEENCDRTPEKK